MANDMSSDGLFSISCEHCATINLGNDLVSDDDGDAEFVGYTLQGAKELC